MMQHAYRDNRFSWRCCAVVYSRATDFVWVEVAWSSWSRRDLGVEGEAGTTLPRRVRLKRKAVAARTECSGSKLTHLWLAVNFSNEPSHTAISNMVKEVYSLIVHLVQFKISQVYDCQRLL